MREVKISVNVDPPERQTFTDDVEGRVRAELSKLSDRKALLEAAADKILNLLGEVDVGIATYERVL